MYNQEFRNSSKYIHRKYHHLNKVKNVGFQNIFVKKNLPKYFEKSSKNFVISIFLKIARRMKLQVKDKLSKNSCFTFNNTQELKYSMI